MNWIVLIASGMMESVWAVALGKSEGFSNVGPTIVFAVAIILSMLGLAYAVKSLPVGVAYAVWTGIGVVGTTAYGVVTGSESISLLRVLLLMGLVGCIAGLRLTSD